MNKEKIKAPLPDGETYKEYDEEIIYTDNEYIVNYNINNIKFLYSQYDGLADLVANLPDLSGVYTKNEIDNMLQNYYTKEAIDDTFTNYFTKTEIDNMLQNYYTKNEIDNTFSNYYTVNEVDTLLTDYIDIDTYTEDIEEIHNEIDTNTQAINTLNDIVEQNFETFGRYNIQGMNISDGDPVRFMIIEDIPLDPEYVTVSLSPSGNQFVNLQNGKITFNIIADGIINSGTTDLTLELKIYANGNQIDAENKVVEAGKTVSVNFAGTFEVEANDIVYATLQIITGAGTLSTINPVIINIDFKSNSTSAIKSSQIVNDYLDLPDNGINPEFVLNHHNADNIETNTNDITNLQNDNLNLANQIDTNTNDITNLQNDNLNLANQIDNNSESIDKINNETILFENLAGQQANIPSGYVNLSESIYNFKEIMITGFIDANSYRDKSFVLSIPTSIITINTTNDDLNKRNRKFIIEITGGGDQLEVQFNNANQLQTTWYNQERITRVIGKWKK